MGITFRIGELAVIFCVSVIVIFFKSRHRDEDFTTLEVYDTFCKALLITSLCKMYLAL